MLIDFPPIPVSVQGLEWISLPRMVKIRQHYDPSRIDDIAGTVHSELERKVTDKTVFTGKHIAITAGSRGIPHYPLILRALVDTLTSWGAKPFIVPAMGSHAGASAEGQREMLAGFGITEETVGCRILSSLETVPLGRLDDGTEIYCDKNAFEADGILVFNKVKPHTMFKAEHESGLLKMMVIGLGKHRGAASAHAQGYGKFPKILLEGGELFLAKTSVVLGLGIVQNAQDDISDIEAFLPDELVEGDARLLRIAKEKMPRFLFPEADIVVIDQIGKDISGSGFDPNVVARKGESIPGALKNQIIFCRGLTEETHHNATGLYAADVTTLRCVRDTDWGVTWTNTMTAVPTTYCRIPCFAPDDHTALLWAVKSLTKGSQTNPTMVRIRDTLHLEYIEVSENLAECLRGREDIEILSEGREIVFDEDGYFSE